MLDLSTQSDIFEAWEKEHFSIVNNFKADTSNTPVQLKLSDYISTLPSALILQLNRTKIDEAGKFEKQFHKVQIPSSLNPARFLLENREDLEKKREQTRLMKDEIEKL